MRKDFALLYVDIIETLANANINYDSFAISTVVLFVKKLNGLEVLYFVPAPELFHFRPIIIALPRPRSRLVTLQK